MKTVAADACTFVSGRNLPDVIAKVRDAFSVELTDAPRRSVGAGIEFIGIGPGRWLALAPETGLAQRLEAALALAASIFEQGGGLVLLEAEGGAMDGLLAKLAPLDLNPDVFPVGAAATTTAAHVNMTLWRCEGGVLALRRGPVLPGRVPAPFLLRRCRVRAGLDRLSLGWGALH